MMRDPFNAPFAFVNSDHKSSSGDFSSGESSTRNQYPKVSLPDDFDKDMDPDIKELYTRTRSQEEEILTLRKQVSEAGLKELQSLSEKHILERKLTELRIAFDEKQEDSINSTLKELNQKKSHIEENLRLANDLKVVEEDVFTFTSSLISVLAENEIRPALLNASTLSNNTKRVYQQMNFKLKSLYASLGITNDNLTIPSTSRNQFPPFMEPRRNEFNKPNPYGMMNPQFETPRFTENNNNSDFNNNNNNNNNNNSNSNNFAHNSNFNNNNFPFHNDPPSRAVVNATTNPTNNYYDEHNSRSEYSDDDNLPGIDNFQINGDAKPANKVTASGFPVNGTTLCVFQWVRYFKNGEGHSIEGATLPDYYITADDVGSVLAVDCTPIDDNGLQGDLVRQFANNQLKITVEPDMESVLDTYVSSGRARFEVYTLGDSADDWEYTILYVQKSAYHVKLDRTKKVILEEKYSPELTIKVPTGYSTQFVLVSSGGLSIPFNTEGISESTHFYDDVRFRDLIVITLRTFQKMDLDAKKKEAQEED